jgi:hypothetical protein
VALRSAVAAFALAALLHAPASAQSQGVVRVDVMVIQLSQQPGPIDARAQRLHRKLHAQFRYESLRVLQRERLALAVDQLASLQLPNGRTFRIRPLTVGERSVLMAVSIEGTLQTDMRIGKHKLVAIRAGPFEAGSLVISLEPDF